MEKGIKRSANDPTSSEPGPKRFKSDYSETVTVFVGPDQDSFAVHKTIACDSSPFFKAACSKLWFEGKENVIHLPDANAASFETFLRWIYAGELKIEEKSDLSSKNGERYPKFTDLGEVWGLANYLQNRPLRNRVIDRLLQKFDALPSCQASSVALTQIWAETPKDSTIRRVMIDVHLSRIPREDFDKYVDELPLDLVVAAARQFFAGNVKKLVKCPTYADRCKYHEHGKGKGTAACAEAKSLISPGKVPSSSNQGTRRTQ